MQKCERQNDEAHALKVTDKRSMCVEERTRLEPKAPRWISSPTIQWEDGPTIQWEVGQLPGIFRPQIFYPEMEKISSLLLTALTIALTEKMQVLLNYEVTNECFINAKIVGHLVLES